MRKCGHSNCHCPSGRGGTGIAGYAHDELPNLKADYILRSGYLSFMTTSFISSSLSHNGSPVAATAFPDFTLHNNTTLFSANHHQHLDGGDYNGRAGWDQAGAFCPSNLATAEPPAPLTAMKNALAVWQFWQ